MLFARRRVAVWLLVTAWASRSVGWWDPAPPATGWEHSNAGGQRDGSMPAVWTPQDAGYHNNSEPRLHGPPLFVPGPDGRIPAHEEEHPRHARALQAGVWGGTNYGYCGNPITFPATGTGTVTASPANTIPQSIVVTCAAGYHVQTGSGSAYCSEQSRTGSCSLAGLICPSGCWCGAVGVPGPGCNPSCSTCGISCNNCPKGCTSTCCFPDSCGGWSVSTKTSGCAAYMPATVADADLRCMACDAPPGAPSNGNIAITGSPPYSATYTCKSGFYGAPTTKSCVASASSNWWQGATIACTACGVPYKIGSTCVNSDAVTSACTCNLGYFGADFGSTCNTVTGWNIATTSTCQICGTPPYYGAACVYAAATAACGCVPGFFGAPFNPVCNTRTGWAGWVSTCVACGSTFPAAYTCTLQNAFTASCTCAAGYFPSVATSGAITASCDTVLGWAFSTSCVSCSMGPSFSGITCTLGAGGTTANCECQPGYYGGTAAASCSTGVGWKLSTPLTCTPCGNPVLASANCTAGGGITGTCTCNSGFVSASKAPITGTCSTRTGWSLTSTCVACGPAASPPGAVCSASGVCTCGPGRWGTTTFPATCHPVLGWQVATNPCSTCIAPPFVGGNCTVVVDKATCGCLTGTQPNVTSGITATCDTQTGFGPYSGACIPCSSPVLYGSSCTATVYETSAGLSRPVRASCQCSAGWFGPAAFEAVCQNQGWQPVNANEGCTACSNSTYNVAGASCVLQTGGFSATCECDPGYYLSSDTSNPVTVTCSPSYGWLISSAGGNRCTPCGNVSKTVFPRSLCTVTSATTASCICDAGFHSGGLPPAPATCSRSTGWAVPAAVVPTCYPCDLTNFEGNTTLYDPATMTYNVTAVSPLLASAVAEITLTCKAGYMPQTGKLTCDPISGEWVGNILACLPPTRTPTVTPSRTPSSTATPSGSSSVSRSPSPSRTVTPSGTATPTASGTPSPSPVSPSPTPQVLTLSFAGHASMPANSAVNTTIGFVTLGGSYTPPNATWSLVFAASNAAGRALVRLQKLNATAAALVLAAPFDTPSSCTPDDLLVAAVQACDPFLFIGVCDTVAVLLTVAVSAAAPACTSASAWVLPVVVTRITPPPPPTDPQLADPFPLILTGIASDPNAGNTCGVSGLSYVFPASVGGVALEGGASSLGLFYMDASGSITLNSDLATVGAGNYTAVVRITEGGPLALYTDCSIVMVVSCHPSAIGYAAACAPPSTTPSSTPTSTRSRSASATSSLTASPSATASETASASRTRSPSATAAGSVSATVTPSVTSTSSPSSAGTASATASTTASTTATASRSSSGTASAAGSTSPSATSSASLTPSPSVSRSPGSSATLTASPSVSGTPTASISPSASVPPSVTASTSTSATPSPSVSASASLAPTTSATPSSSVTTSGTASQAASPSLTPSPSVSASNSGTPTRTSSPTRSISRSPSRTVTQSSAADPSSSPTPTSSSTITATRTRSSSKTPSVSASGTPSSTGTPSNSVTPSRTTSVSMTFGGTPSVSPSATPSSSGSASSTVSPSGTASGSRAASPSSSASVVSLAASASAAPPSASPAGSASTAGGPSQLGAPSLGPYTALEGAGMRIRLPAKVQPQLPAWVSAMTAVATGAARIVVGPALPPPSFALQVTLPAELAAWVAAFTSTAAGCTLGWAADVPEPPVTVLLPLASPAPRPARGNTSVVNGFEAAAASLTLQGSLVSLAAPLSPATVGLTVGRLDCWADLVVTPGLAPWASASSSGAAAVAAAARAGLAAAVEAATIPGGALASAVATAGTQVLWLPGGALTAPHWVDALVEALEPATGALTLRSAWSSVPVPLTSTQAACWGMRGCFNHSASVDNTTVVAGTPPPFLKAATHALLEPAARTPVVSADGFPFLLPLADRTNVTMLAAVPPSWFEQPAPSARSLSSAGGLPGAARAVADAGLTPLGAPLRLAWRVSVNGLPCPVSWAQLFAAPGAPSSSQWIAVRFETPSRTDLARLDAWMHGFDDRLAGATPPSPPSTLGELPLTVSIDRVWVDAAIGAPAAPSTMTNLAALWTAASPGTFWGPLGAALKATQAATAASLLASSATFTEPLVLPVVGNLCPYDCPADFTSATGAASIAATCALAPEDGPGPARLRRLPLPGASSPLGKALAGVKDALASRGGCTPISASTREGAASAALASIPAATGLLLGDGSCQALAALPFPLDIYTGRPRALRGGAGAAAGLDLDPTSAVMVSSDSVVMQGAVYLKPCAEVPPVDGAARDATGTALLVGGFTDPSRGACLNASSPAAARCPYQSKEGACAACPTGALCLGRRAFALGGYWSPSAVESVPLECPDPSTPRCTGYQPANFASGCAAGYLAASSACAACDFGFFPDTSGACISCPAVSSGLSWPLMRPLVVMAAGAVVIGALIFGMVFLAMRRRGGTVKGGLQRAAQFVAASLLIIQTVSQALGSVRSAPSQPPALKALVSTVDWLTLEDVSIHPNCATSTPFLTNYLLFGAALLLSAGALLLAGVDATCLGPLKPLQAVPAASDGAASNGSARGGGLAKAGSLSGGLSASARSNVMGRAGVSGRGASAEDKGEGKAEEKDGEDKTDGALRPRSVAPALAAKKPSLGARFGRALRLRGAFIAFALLSILYGAYTGSAFRTLRCQDSQMTVASYLVLNQDGSTLVKAGICDASGCKPSLANELARVVTVRVLTKLPSQVCWEGTHRPVALLAVTVLVFASVFVPLVTLPWVWHRLSASARLVGVYYAVVRNRGGSAGESGDRSGGTKVAAAAAGSEGGSEGGGSVRSLPEGGTSGRGTKKKGGASGRAKGLMTSDPSAAEAPGGRKKRTALGALTSAMGCAPVRPDAVASARLAGCIRIKRFSPLDDSTAPPVAMVLGADRLTSFFTRSEFWPSRFFSKHVDYATILVLSALSNLGDALVAPAARLAGSIAVVTVAAILLLSTRPYRAEVRFNFPVKLGCYLVTILAALCSYYVATKQLDKVEPLAWMLLISGVLLLLTLLYYFWVVLLRGAVEEEVAAAAAKEAVERVDDAESAVLRALALGGKDASTQRLPPALMAAALSASAESGGRVPPPTKSLLAAERAGLSLGVPPGSFAPAPLGDAAAATTTNPVFASARAVPAATPLVASTPAVPNRVSVPVMLANPIDPLVPPAPSGPRRALLDAGADDDQEDGKRRNTRTAMSSRVIMAQDTAKSFAGVQQTIRNTRKGAAAAGGLPGSALVSAVAPFGRSSSRFLSGQVIAQQVANRASTGGSTFEPTGTIGTGGAARASVQSTTSGSRLSIRGSGRLSLGAAVANSVTSNSSSNVNSSSSSSLAVTPAADDSAGGSQF